MIYIIIAAEEEGYVFRFVGLSVSPIKYEWILITCCGRGTEKIQLNFAGDLNHPNPKFFCRLTYYRSYCHLCLLCGEIGLGKSNGASISISCVTYT